MERLGGWSGELRRMGRRRKDREVGRWREGVERVGSGRRVKERMGERRGCCCGEGK